MFITTRYRPNRWVFYVLVIAEIPVTVALLALFGIATPDTYRTKLWQDGSDNGFNSSPLSGLYAAANYRPYNTPKVWSQLYASPHSVPIPAPPLTADSLTNYNVSITILSVFILLVKVGPPQPLSSAH